MLWFNDIAVTVNQVASGIDLPSKIVHRTISSGISLYNDFLCVWIFFNLTNHILDFVSFTLVVQQIRQIAQILQHLFIEFDMAFVVNNVFTLINQETTLVDSSVIFISKLTIFILQKDGFARLVIIVKVAHNLMWIKIPFLKSVRHRQITEILTSLLYGHKKIFISESTPDSSRLLVNQIPFLIHQLTI